jgi:hypothetical protein
MVSRQDGAVYEVLLLLNGTARGGVAGFDQRQKWELITTSSTVEREAADKTRAKIAGKSE